MPTISESPTILLILVVILIFVILNQRVHGYHEFYDFVFLIFRLEVHKMYIFGGQVIILGVNIVSLLSLLLLS